MRDTGTLAYKLGTLETDYHDLLNQGDLDENFTVYDAFHDRSIHDKGYLRRLARKKGRIDALTYILNDDTPPVELDWLTDDLSDLQANIETSLIEIVTERGTTGTTWTDYHRGWIMSLCYARGNSPDAYLDNLRERSSHRRRP